MIFISLLWILFVLSALLLSLLILIQEGKGGGLAEAFGGQGAETFGVKATGVNYFTGGVAALMFLCAILINKCAYQTGGVHFAPASSQSTPANPNPTGTNPGDGGSGGTSGSQAPAGGTEKK